MTSHELIRRSTWLLPALAVAALYSQVRAHGFIEFDDMAYTYENPMVAKGLTREGFVWAFSNSHIANYHPLTWLSHMLDVGFFGMSPGAFTLVNAGFHAANATLVAVLFSFLFRSRKIGITIGIIFAVHPQLVEAVAWISQRKTVLCTFFGLWTILFHLGSREALSRGRAYWLQGAALFAYALSLLAKGMFVTMPVLLFLLEMAAIELRGRTEPGRTGPAPTSRAAFTISSLPSIVWRLAPYLFLGVAFSLLTIWAQAKDHAVQTLGAIPLADRLANMLSGLSVYAEHFVYPAKLSVFYPRNDAWTAMDILVPGGVLLALTFGLYRVRRAAGETPFLGWCFFLVALLPVIGLIQVGEQSSADRYMYQPILGLLLVGASLFASLPRRLATPAAVASGALPRQAASSRIAKLVSFGLVAWIALCACAGYRQIHYWRNSYVLADASQANIGPNPQLLVMQTAVLLHSGNYEAAKQLARLALQLAPTHLMALQNLAVAEYSTGNKELAIQLCRRHISLAPDETAPYVNLAFYLAGENRWSEATAAVASARRIRTLSISEQNLLAVVEKRITAAHQSNAPENP